MHKTHNPFCIVIVYDYGRKEIKRKNSSLLLRHISDKDPGTQIVKYAVFGSADLGLHCLSVFL